MRQITCDINGFRAASACVWLAEGPEFGFKLPTEVWQVLYPACLLCLFAFRKRRMNIGNAAFATGGGRRWRLDYDAASSACPPWAVIPGFPSTDQSAFGNENCSIGTFDGVRWRALPQAAARQSLPQCSGTLSCCQIRAAVQFRTCRQQPQPTATG